MPMRVVTNSLESRIFNSLIEQCDALGLAWHSPMDVSNDGAGTVMLKVLSKALTYLLPFDINGILPIPKNVKPTSWVRVTSPVATLMLCV